MNGQIAESQTISRLTSVLYDSILVNKVSNQKRLNRDCDKQRSKQIDEEAANLLKFTLATFLNNICNVCFVEESSLILSLIYLDRILLKRKMSLSYEVLEELMLGCVIAAVKFNQDYHNLRYVQAVTRIQQHQITYLESWTLEALGYSLYVDQNIYKTYSFHLTSFKVSSC